MRIANRAAQGIVDHKKIPEDVSNANVPGLQELYYRIKTIYDSEFGSINFVDANDYEYVKENSEKFIRLSYRLLQESSAHDDWQIKKWELLPGATHSIVHVSISGPRTVYGLLSMAHQKNSNGVESYFIPQQLKSGNRLIYFHQFRELYSNFQDKQLLWENLFDFNKVQSRRLLDEQDSSNLQADNNRHVRFAFSIKTDGTMISTLFEAKKSFWNPHKIGDLKFQKRNTDLTYVNKGIYPLNKNPVGINVNDLIIGIDPGIICRSS